MPCFELTTGQLAEMLDAGYTLSGGPFTTEAECLANCTGGSGSGSTSGSGGVAYPCCPEITLPESLLLTISMIPGAGCDSCFPGGPIEITLFYDPVGFGNGPGWYFIGSVSNGGNCVFDETSILSFTCAAGEVEIWTLFINAELGDDGCCIGQGNGAAATSCSPFLWECDSINDGLNHGCTAAAGGFMVHYAITEL